MEPASGQADRSGPEPRTPERPAIAGKNGRMDVLYGLHPVEEAIRARAGALDRVSIAKEARDGRLEHLVQACRDAGIRVSVEPREQLTRYANTDAHQGVVGFIRERKFLTLEDLLETSKNRRASTASFWLWTAWKTPTTWALCCARPMAPAQTASY